MMAMLITILLGLFTLGNKIREWFKTIALEALMESKLIRYPAIGTKNWPNGADTLPDAIQHLWETQVDIKTKLDALRKEKS